jgi:large subunit ribosomal protein L18e
MKNTQLMELVQELKKNSIENKVKIWKRLAADLEKPTRKRREVNLYKIDKAAKEDEIIVVPGKVLGTGELTKKVKVAAYNFSESACKKINSKGQVMSIQELIKTNPKGKKVRILG